MLQIKLILQLVGPEISNSEFVAPVKLKVPEQMFVKYSTRVSEIPQHDSKQVKFSHSDARTNLPLKLINSASYSNNIFNPFL